MTTATTTTTTEQKGLRLFEVLGLKGGPSVKLDVVKEAEKERYRGVQRRALGLEGPLLISKKKIQQPDVLSICGKTKKTHAERMIPISNSSNRHSPQKHKWQDGEWAAWWRDDASHGWLKSLFNNDTESPGLQAAYFGWKLIQRHAKKLHLSEDLIRALHQRHFQQIAKRDSTTLGHAVLRAYQAKKQYLMKDDKSRARRCQESAEDEGLVWIHSFMKESSSVLSSSSFPCAATASSSSAAAPAPAPVAPAPSTATTGLVSHESAEFPLSPLILNDPVSVSTTTTETATPLAAVPPLPLSVLSFLTTAVPVSAPVTPISTPVTPVSLEDPWNDGLLELEFGSSLFGSNLIPPLPPLEEEDL